MPLEVLMRVVELASFPVNQIARREGFVQGAKAALDMGTRNSGGDDPMCIDWVTRDTGNVHVFLLIGKWVGPYEAVFPEIA
jgi:hypothetical protein